MSVLNPHRTNDTEFKDQNDLNITSNHPEPPQLHNNPLQSQQNRGSEHQTQQQEQLDDPPSENNKNNENLTENTRKIKVEETESFGAKTIGALSPFQTGTEFPELGGKYRVIENIGEGSFSRVYKAEVISSPGTFVAIKRLFPTSGPSRALKEARLLAKLGGTHNVSEVLEGLRWEDQVSLVLPYFEHGRFRDFYRSLDTAGTAAYVSELFQALKWIHEKGVIHRDIKPSNCLWNPSTKSLFLVDFGLSTNISNSGVRTPVPPVELNRKSSEGSSHHVLQEVLGSGKPAVPRNRPSGALLSPMAPRAGTRGFRPPEVLFRWDYQGVEVDVWAGGVILLSIMTGIYPFFVSGEDASALWEIALLRGSKALQDAATSCGKKLGFRSTETRTPGTPGISLVELVARLRDIRRRKKTMEKSERDKLARGGTAQEWMDLVREEPRRELDVDLSSDEGVKKATGWPKEAFDLLERCLDLDPIKRATADEVLASDFVKKFLPET